MIGGISKIAEGGSIADVFISAVAGAANGVLAASGAGLATSMVLSGAISGASTFISQVLTGEINLPEVIVDTAVGVICGGIAGSGASSVASGAGGAKQVIDAGKQSVTRVRKALSTTKISRATVVETKKAGRHYLKTTKKVTKNLFSKRNLFSTIGSTIYSLGKRLFKR